MKTKITLLLLAFFMFVGNAYSQTGCEIEVADCPPTLSPKCADTQVGGVFGTYVTWTPPDFSIECDGGTGTGYDFSTNFDLPESQNNCWKYNFVQRTGTGGGRIRLFQSTGVSGTPTSFTTPSFFMVASPIDCLIAFDSGSGNPLVCKVYLVLSDGTKVATPLATVNLTGDSSYTFTINPVTAGKPAGIYRLLYEFTGAGNNSDYIDILAIDAPLISTTCGGDINFFTVSTNNPGSFFPVGTTTVTYTSTCNSCTPVLTKTCSFDVVVNGVTASATTTNSNCGLSNGSMTITATSSNATKALQYNLNNTSWVNFTTPVTLTGLAPGSYSVNVRDYFANNSSYCNILVPLTVVVGQTTDGTPPVITCPANITKTADAGICGAVVTYTAPIGSDTCTNGVTTTQTAGLASGATFPVGTTTNTFKVTDAAGNETSCSFTVTITDNEAPKITCPSNFTVGTNTACTYVGSIGTATATDNCTASGSIVITNNAPAAFPIGSTTVTWTATDAKGNSATCTQLVTVNDDDAPIISCPAAFTIGTNTACTYVGSIGTATATDNCSATGSIVITNNAPAAFPIGSTTVTWTATDAKGNSATCTQLVTVSDDDAPIISCPAAFTIGTNTACTYVGSIGTATATDNCSATGSIVITNNAPATFPIGSTTVTWTATDAKGNSATCTQLVTVNDDDAPIISCPAAFTIGTNTACTYVGSIGTATATDNCSATGSIVITNNAPAAFPIGSTTVTWTATDAKGNSATCTQLVTVNDDDAPIISCPAAFTIGTNTACTYVGSIGTATATDNCSATGSIVITNNAPAAFPIGSTTVTWTATDAKGNSATCTQLVTVSDDDAPIISCPAAFTIGTNTACTYVGSIGTATATDNCSATGSIVITNNAPAAFPIGSTTVTWTATDAKGNSATCTQLVTVSDDDAPIISCPAAFTIGTNTACTYVGSIGTATATDNCSATGSIVITNNAPAAFPIGSTTVTWTATDAKGNSATCTQLVTVNDDDAPIISCPAAFTIGTNTACTYVGSIGTATATDNCSATGSIVITNNAPAAFPIGSTTVTWTATDAKGNSATCTQLVTVNDDDAPIISCPAAFTIGTNTACTYVGSIGTATATDNCSATGSIVITNNAPAAFPIGSTTVTWTATDAKGNSATCTQLVTVSDDDAPIISCPAAFTIGTNTACTYVGSIGTATATDNCSATGSIVITNNAPAAFPIGSTTVTWTATDAKGNSATCTQLVTVSDDDAPIISCPAAFTIGTNTACTYVGSIGTATATDNCSATGSIVITNNAPAAFPIGSTTVTWTATDAKGNSATCTQLVTVSDDDAPAITQAGANTTLNCPATPTFTAPTATDNCGTATINVVSDITTPGACVGAYSRTITWDATDVVGNHSNQISQTITVQDTTAPTFTGPANITINKDATCNANTDPSITGSPTNVQDNCDSSPIIPTYTDASCFDYSIQTQMNHGQGYYYPVEISGYNNLTAGQLQKVAMQFTTNQGKGNGEFILIAPSGDGIVLIGSHCDGGFCEVAGSTTYNPTFYPSTSSYTKWVNSDNIAPGSGNFEPNGGTLTNPTIDSRFNGNYKTRFEDLTGSMNGTWYLYGKKDTSASGTMEFSGVCISPTACEGNTLIIRSWTATDACGNTSAPFKQIINVVDNTAPTWTTAAGSLDVTLECSDAAGLATAKAAFPIASDNCDLDVSNIIKISGAFVAGTCANSGTYTNTWTVTDNCGNLSATFTQVITVQDKTAPVLSAAPADAIAECDAVPTASAADLTATDNCDAAPVVTYNEARTDGNCVSNYTLTRTWTATDVCGNTSSKSQVITVQDKTAPVLSAAPADVTAECDAVPTASAADLTATDNCDAAPVVTYNEVRADGNCASNYTLTRTWTATDVCGNTSSKSQVITVQDKTAPVLSAAPADVTAECDAVPTASAADLTATDNCDAAPVVTYNEVRADGNCASNYTLTRTWTATDVCGNTSSKSQVITVKDTTAPVLSAAPADVTAECDAVPTASAADLTATDNCDAAPVVTYNEARTDGNCASNYTLTRTWTATDVCGNTSSKSQVITVQDKTAPVLSAAPADTSAECSAVPTASAADLTATDNCDAAPVVTYNEVRTDGNCVSNYTLTRTWTATDVCGNSSSKSQVITVKDTTAPVLSAAPADVTAECSAVPTASAADLTATDNCDAAPVVTYNEVRTDGNCVSNYTLTRTWTATDVCGNTSSKSQVITVKDTTAPTITTQATNISVECDGSGNQNAIADWLANNGGATATDNCSEIKWTNDFNALSNDCSKPVYIKFTATDACGNTSSTTASFTIVDTTKPSITAAGENTTINCPATPNFTAPTATDTCGNATVNIISTITTPGSCAGNYSVTRTWDATDACGNHSAEVSQTITVQDITKPTFVEALPADITVECSAVPTAETLTATDTCGTATVEFNETSAAGACTGAYILTRTWTATDACNNVTTHVQKVTVQDTTKPTFVQEVLPADITVECSAVPTAETLTATDNCGTASVAYNETSTEGNCANNYTLTRTWTATDACGLTTIHTQIIKVQDTTAPVIAVPPTRLSINCPETPVFAEATATDNCSSPVLTFADVKTEGACAGSYSVTRTWTATDACGNSSTANQTIRVKDITAPVIDALPETTTISCPATPAFAVATATDDCGSAVTLTSADVTTNGNCAGSYSVTRTWTATDACGNASTASQTINVQDVTAPVIAELPAASTISCPAAPAFAVATATDDCGSAVTLTSADITTNGNCAGSYSVTRTWTATDACGNASTASQTINVQDVTAPVIAELPAASTISCPATPDFAVATATDACGSTVTLTSADITTNGNCAGSYSVTRTWTATDACGNASTASQTINVQDVTAPVIAELPAASTISCPATPAFAVATATDACGSTVTLTSADVTTNGTCVGSYSVTRTWTATDACGNTSTASQTINVQDITAPIIATLPEPTTISCPATPAFAVATATDACGSTVTLTSADITTNGNCAGSYSVTRTWTATDACGNASTASQTINVQDVTAPVIAELPAASTISCPATPAFAVATATDACGSTFTLTSANVTTPGGCAGSYTVTRTWTATDACGNASTASQTINVTDTVAPVIAALPAISTISCPATPAFAVATATDACGGEVILTSADVTTPGGCAGSYSVTRTWTAKDSCGNTATASQTINVTDTTGPTTNTSFASTVDVKCDAVPAKPELVFEDNCSTVNTPVYTEKITNQTPTSYSIVREWNVTDTCGNKSTFTQTVNVTIANTGTVIPSKACNASTDTVDLNTLLPAGTPTNGTWIDVNNSGHLQGSILSPYEMALGDYIFEYKVTDGSCPLSIKINMTVNFDCKVLGCEAIVVHKAFTPNWDGVNDTLTIDGVEDNICYPSGISVEIYNRWGILVFETTKYNNSSNVFDGYSRGRTTISKSDGLPTGTYFYIVNYESFDGNGNIQMNRKDGFIYLSR